MKKKIFYTIGLIFMIIPFFINVYSIFRLVSLLCGIIIILLTFNNFKSTKFNILIFIYLGFILFVNTYCIDYLLASFLDYYPIYTYRYKSNENVKVYNSIFYRVYDCKGSLVFDNNYSKEYACNTSLIESDDINKVLSDKKAYYKNNHDKFVKITGKVSKINGNSSIELRSFVIDEDNTLNGYVVFDKNSQLDIMINNKMDVSHYKIYDYITVIGRVDRLMNNTITLADVVIEENDLYEDYTLSVIEPTECNEIKEYVDGYYTYCISNIYLDYGIDKYELSYALKDKKITFDNLKRKYLKLEEQEDLDLYYFEKFNILVCNENKKIILNKNSVETYSFCETE